ncbi:hypothetical protein ACFYY2_32870 [Streptomyces sp. NPDC001822]|uniref:hypothetical protein n=1 Tax=Streptomyces sp. NPDC001822 TaxID=3364614 RepID=UPI0036B2555F
MVPKVDKVGTPPQRWQAAGPRARSSGLNPVHASGYFVDVPVHVMSFNTATVCMVKIESVAAVVDVDATAGAAGLDVSFSPHINGKAIERTADRRHTGRSCAQQTSDSSEPRTHHSSGSTGGGRPARMGFSLNRQGIITTMMTIPRHSES